MQSKSLHFIPSFSTDPRASLLCNSPRWWVPRNRKLPPVAALRAAASSRPCATSAIEVHVADASPKRFGPVYFEERIEKVVFSFFLTIHWVNFCWFFVDEFSIMWAAGYLQMQVPDDIWSGWVFDGFCSLLSQGNLWFFLVTYLSFVDHMFVNLLQWMTTLL